MVVAIYKMNSDIRLEGALDVHLLGRLLVCSELSVDSSDTLFDKLEAGGTAVEVEVEVEVEVGCLAEVDSLSASSTKRSSEDGFVVYLIWDLVDWATELIFLVGDGIY